MTDSITLGYWGIRGLGQVPRLLLAYSGLSWNNKAYVTREAWFDEDKKNLGLTFPNLPYLVDGDFKVTESRAIALYIIKKSGKTDLLGKTVQDEALVESIIGVITDLRHALIPLVFDPTWKDKIAGVIGKGTPKLAELQKFYGEREFAVGYLSYADFVISEFSYYVEHITPELFTQHPFLKRVRDAVEAQPEIKAYYASDKATKGPFFPPTAAIQF